MKIAYIVILLIVAVLAVIFAVQNSGTVTVALFGWAAEAPLSLVLIVAFAVGILIGIFLLVPSLWKKSWALSREKHTTKKLSKLAEDAESKAGTAPAETPDQQQEKQ